MKNRSILSGILLLMFVLTACGGHAPVSTPTVDPSAVAAVVSTMIAGVPTAIPLPQPTVTLTPEPPTVLPRSLYYLAQDANGKTQIYRLGRDGVTIAQITFEQDGVLDFDVSPIDGTLAYRLEDDLIVIDANGNNRQLLVSQPNITFSPSPIWSPSGRSIVYESGGNIVQYSFDTNDSQILVLGTDADAKWPISFSPDGSKLFLRRRVIPSSSGTGEGLIYDFASQILTPVPGKFCSTSLVTWNTTNTLFCSNSGYSGAGMPGLWMVNLVNGSAEKLIFSDSCPPCLNVVAPHQDTTGNLYYLYAESNNIDTPLILSLVSAKSDGITDRVVLRPETFNVLKVLWSPNSNALLILLSEDQTPSPTSLILVPLDSSLPVVTIMADASTLFSYSLRWGP